MFDGTLMAAIMDMETQNNNKDAAFVGMLKSKGRAKKWRKRASLKRNSGVVLDNDDANLEGKVGRVFPVVIWSEFRWRKYRVDDHREDAPHFK